MSSSVFQEYQAEHLSAEYTNGREEQQAVNLISALQSMPAEALLLVWCGNSHHRKVSAPEWSPMGFQFQQHSGIEPFVIGQTRTVKFEHNAIGFDLAEQFADDLNKFGGTAGFLSENAPSIFGRVQFADVFILSIHNEL